ncbi:MAG: hypothetical protein HYU84_01890 [Chloroflexi bacterium]|nr:hypothetical protein [Chloroflexota bacterium]MBI3169088.1 hypothetical protein [Chloroflexota bacterium]
MSEPNLHNFFNFNEADLTANRASRLTKTQEARLLETERGVSQIFKWAGVFLLLLAFGITLLLLNEARKLNWQDLAGMTPALCVVWFICGGFAYGALKIAGSKNDHSVQKAEGKVNFVKVEKRVSNTSSSGPRYRTVQEYELRVGKIAFEDVDEELLNLIEEGDVYAFYYTKDTKDILSCEFISKEK